MLILKPILSLKDNKVRYLLKIVNNKIINFLIKFKINSKTPMKNHSLLKIKLSLTKNYDNLLSRQLILFETFLICKN